MNQGDQLILAKAKAEKRAKEREIQLRSKLDMIIYMLTEDIHTIDDVQIDEALVLVHDAVELQASRKEALATLKRLGG